MSDQNPEEMIDCDEQLLEMFVSNAADLLDQIEADLLKLEHMGDDWDDELVNKVFRSAHTIKGESGFVGLEVIGKLSHSIENVLDKVRERIFVADHETINLLLECFDELRRLTDEVETSNEADVSDYVSRLEVLVGEKTGQSPSPTTQEQPSQEQPVQEPEQCEQVAQDEVSSVDFQSADESNFSPTAFENKPGEVLIVDDDPMIRKLLCYHLDNASVTSQTAESCSECLQLLSKNSYRVIVLDIDLPDGQGYGILHEIKQLHPLVQIVMLTGEVSMHNVVRCLEAGAIDFLSKTGSYEEILEPIQSALERSKRWKKLLNGKRQPATV